MILLRPALLALALAATAAGAYAETSGTFAAFTVALWPDAAARGITRQTYDIALTGVTPDPAVLGAMRREPEYGKPMATYLGGLIAPGRIAQGQQKSVQWAETLQAIEQRYGTNGSILVSIWGIESSFGNAAQRWDVFRSLATLAYAGFQHPLFHDELLSAMTILQDGRVPRQQFVGSWAGAMGQPQFLPSSYLAYAVDFDGDGTADIWNSVPDVLASIANYLEKFGWRRGLPWGFEVLLPANYDYRNSRGSFAQWTQRGIMRLDGGRFPAAGDAILFFPSGAPGPAFLVTENFVVLKKYNNSDAYALAVAGLSERLRGQSGFRSAWPVNDYQPSRGERIALQRKLAELGFKVADLVGHLDFEQRDAVRVLQAKLGMVPDGYPGREFLTRIGLKAP
jgi:lytic murein transglycosylase